MQVLGISGTPRPGGNSEVLLEAALQPWRQAQAQITKVLLSQTTIAACDGCESCQSSGRCHQRDGMDEVYDAYKTCDAILIAAPVYWRNVPAPLKALMDRTFAIREKEWLRDKPGGALVVGRGTGGGQAQVLSLIYTFYLSCGMLAVPGELNGVSAVANAPGEIANQPRRLQQAKILGENVLRCHMKMRGL